MDSIFIDMAITVFIGYIKKLVNAESKNQAKKVVYKVFKEIAKQYKDDADFRNVFNDIAK